MAKVQVIYDGMQHCTSLREQGDKIVAMDCPYTGEGQEFSTLELIGSSVAGSMLLTMGAYAMRHEIDITGTTVDVEVQATNKIIQSIDLVFNMQKNFSTEERMKLEIASGFCPITHSFLPEVKISVTYKYPK